MVAMQIKAIGDDVLRPGIGETPARVVKSWKELYSGYNENPADHLRKRFPIEGSQMVTLNDIEFFSMCEHHMLPFFGRADVTYIANEQACGLSKLARVVEAYARRMQMQENLTKQIADLIESELNPLGVAVRVRGVHMCMRARGVRSSSAEMTTTQLRGAFLDNDSARSEWLANLPK